MKRVFAVLLVLAMSGCSTFTPPRYSISADTNVALKSINLGNIHVGAFTGPAQFDNMCRGAGPIAPPDSLTFEGYIKKALADELKVAGMYDNKKPRVTLTGKVTELAFSSSRGLTGGSWDITLILTSTNVKSITVKEHYEFESGFVADTACKQTAENYMAAVQNLIRKIVTSPAFKDLVS